MNCFDFSARLWIQTLQLTQDVLLWLFQMQLDQPFSTLFPSLTQIC